MSKEEALIYWEWKYENIKDYFDPHWEGSERREHREYVQAVEWAIKALKGADRPQEWIPCSGRLPEETADYLCWIINPYDESIQYHLICAWYAGAKKWSSYDETASSNVVAWMPLPEWKGADDE